MADHVETSEAPCCCGPAHGFSDDEACAPCPPKMALTHEEEAILTRMRAIKERVRPIADRMNELHRAVKDSPEGVSGFSNGSEWNELSDNLEELRSEWKNWEQKLDEAIEQKLIALGHREP
jgi:DNA repair exonuclease SbcCD ATPase subunit